MSTDSGNKPLATGFFSAAHDVPGSVGTFSASGDEAAEKKLKPCQIDEGMEPPLRVRCSCVGCDDGFLLFDGFAKDGNGCFMICTTCGHCHYAPMSPDQAARERGPERSG